MSGRDRRRRLPTTPPAMLLLLLPTPPSEVDEKGARYAVEIIAAARLCCCRAGARLNAYIHEFIVLSSLIKHQRIPAALKVENMVGHCFERQNKSEQRHVTCTVVLLFNNKIQKTTSDKRPRNRTKANHRDSSLVLSSTNANVC